MPSATTRLANQASGSIEADERISVECACLPGRLVPLPIFISKYLNGQDHSRRTQIIVLGNSVINNFAVCSNCELGITRKMPVTHYFDFILAGVLVQAKGVRILGRRSVKNQDVEKTELHPTPLVNRLVKSCSQLFSANAALGGGVGAAYSLAVVEKIGVDFAFLNVTPKPHRNIQRSPVNEISATASGMSRLRMIDVTDRQIPIQIHIVIKVVLELRLNVTDVEPLDI